MGESGASLGAIEGDFGPSDIEKAPAVGDFVATSYCKGRGAFVRGGLTFSLLEMILGGLLVLCNALGLELGPKLGTPLGHELGAAVGLALGIKLGKEVGSALGISLGTEVGAALGL